MYRSIGIVLNITGVTSDVTKIKAELREDILQVEVSGTMFGLAEVTEQLLWISTALQTSKNWGADLNFASVRGASFEKNSHYSSVEASSAGQHVGTLCCAVIFSSRQLHEHRPPTRGRCWHHLFRRCDIVAGYPIPSRPLQQPGLEIPLDMMVSLIGADRVTPFDSNLIVKGFSALLFLSDHQDQCLFWHLLYNEDGSQISFADRRIDPEAETDPELLQLRPSDAMGARHIVGWAAEIKQNAGMQSSFRICCPLLMVDAHPRYYRCELQCGLVCP